jgi:hypothetical protein
MKDRSPGRCPPTVKEIDVRGSAYGSGSGAAATVTVVAVGSLVAGQAPWAILSDVPLLATPPAPAGGIAMCLFGGRQLANMADTVRARLVRPRAVAPAAASDGLVGTDGPGPFLLLQRSCYVRGSGRTLKVCGPFLLLLRG